MKRLIDVCGVLLWLPGLAGMLVMAAALLGLAEPWLPQPEPTNPAVWWYIGAVLCCMAWCFLSALLTAWARAQVEVQHG